MEKEKFQNKYCIKSARAVWHNYDSGAYFITVCTNNRNHFFGEVINRSDTQEMLLSPIGHFLTEIIQNATNHCPYVEIPLYIVMPNHWHAIMFIDEDKIPYIRRNTHRDAAYCRDVACRVSTTTMKPP